jgi:uncharacterized protein (TIGR02145 family)
VKKLTFILFIFSIIYSCSKTESTPTATPPVVIKLSSCDSIKQGLLKTTSDTIRLVSCLSITGCDSVRLGLIKSTQDLLRLNCNSLSITIGTQKWMTMNLDVVTYRNGDTIPQVTNPNKWDTLTSGAWCYYNNDAVNGAKYGKLYNWYAVNDLRGLAPKGWHIPSDAEWTSLLITLGEKSGGKMKEVGTLNWKSPNTNATNESGFTGLPGGSRNDFGSFEFLGEYGYWWSVTELDSRTVWNRFLSYDRDVINRGFRSKVYGLSVRCLKD